MHSLSSETIGITFEYELATVQHDVETGEEDIIYRNGRWELMQLHCICCSRRHVGNQPNART